MPKRKDIDAVFMIGAGPIVIGQACEFDYSGTQACKALKQEGLRVALINSNPATIMTDPSMADATYVEPITPETVAQILAQEKSQHPNQKLVLLPTMGGQTALNTAMALAKSGVLEKLDIEMIGAKPDVIDKAEDREKFRQAMTKIGLSVPKAELVQSLDQSSHALTAIGLPAIIRPSFTLGGKGGGIAKTESEFFAIIKGGLAESPTHSVLVEQSVLGWKEFEMEVVRDLKDNAIIICAIENIDPMGVHTGDSITVAPALTLTDKEYQRMRNAALAVLREIGVETGGSNVQFAINPNNGEMLVIEMNPRVSRSSALASKATGFPIAKIASLLAIGYSLDELQNDITGMIPASFEPALDYIVTKIPRFNFEKFKGSDDTLTTSMKSVGEVMAVGRNFATSFQKALASLELPHSLQQLFYIDDQLLSLANRNMPDAEKPEVWIPLLARPCPQRIYYVARALANGVSVDFIHQHSQIDKWFLYQIQNIVEQEKKLAKTKRNIKNLTKELLLQLKKLGYSDENIALQLATHADAVRQKRQTHNITPVYKRIDSCAGEFPAKTPYLYSSYEGNFFDEQGKLQKGEDEAEISSRKKIVILGSGPNRIGQGIEFDYACVHAVLAFKEMGFETIMINCNPETVSTDYDLADRLYFEPLTTEHVLDILEREQSSGELVGVVVQYGGQTPLKLAQAIKAAGFPILGTSPEQIAHAEDRELFKQTLDKYQLQQTQSGTAQNKESAKAIIEQIGYPVMVRPSFVLGGRAMEILYDQQAFEKIIDEVLAISEKSRMHDKFTGKLEVTYHPILIDKYLNDAIEVDVDALSDGNNVVVLGIMQHIEQAGVHSGDSACSLPPYSLGADIIKQLIRQTTILGLALQVRGLMNIQFAVKQNEIYILEMNPRASRTVPFVAKAIGLPIANLGARVMAGQSCLNALTPYQTTLEKLQQLFHNPTKAKFFAVKEAVFPFDRFLSTDVMLGPEMRSTGEVMGIAHNFAAAFAKSQLASGQALPSHANNGGILWSVKDTDKPQIINMVKTLQTLGFQQYATHGTNHFLTQHGITQIQPVAKIGETPGPRQPPHHQSHAKPAEIIELIQSGKIALLCNTVLGRVSRGHSRAIRRAAVTHHVPYCTTIPAMAAATTAVWETNQNQKPKPILPLQQYHALF